MNVNNLIPADQLTPEQRKEQGRKGGKASGRSRKKKAELRTAIQALLDKKYVVDGEKHTGAELLALNLYQEAMNPDSKNYIRAVEAIMKLTDTSEKEKLEIDKLKAQIAILEPDNGFVIDPFSQAIAAYVQASIVSDGGKEIAAIMEKAECME